MTKYSEIHTVEEMDFRYNYEHGLVEYIYFDKENNKTEILDCIGLSKDNWEDGKEGYLMVYANDLDYEMQSMMAGLEEEFGL